MSERHVLTVGELKEYLNSLDLDDNNPVIIIENDSESVHAYNGDRHDSFEGLRLCNVGGVIYNKYEHENALVLGFSYETKFKDIIEHNLPTDGNILGKTLIDIKNNLTFKDAPKLNLTEEEIKEISKSYNVFSYEEKELPKDEK